MSFYVSSLSLFVVKGSLLNLNIMFNNLFKNLLKTQKSYKNLIQVYNYNLNVGIVSKTQDKHRFVIS